LHFKDAALAAQELVAAEEEGKNMGMIFTHLQEQHKAQFKSMAASNKQAMDTMFERMNALIAGHGKAADKVTAPLPTAAQSATERNAQTVENTFFTSQKTATSLRPMQASIGWDGIWPRMPVRQSDRDWGRQIIVQV
jgi:hypothetical protein